MKSQNSSYNSNFYKDQKEGSLNSAKEIVPYVMNLVNPKSVVDVGCGIGTWLSVFKSKGVKKVRGIDGKWVNKNQLIISKEEFIQSDLNNPVNLNSKFDLVISLEVAEHLPKKSADNFVDYLTNLGDIVLFSAAIPYQGGTDHINEQWQDYWVKKFEKKGFLTIDCIRKNFWNNSKVSFFYAQNMLLFVKPSKMNKLLRKEHDQTNMNQISIVHPRRYLDLGMQKEKIFKFIPKPFKKFLSYLSR